MSMRHSVTPKVKPRYTATATKVIAVKRQSNFDSSTAATRLNSSTTGMMENSM